MHAGEQSHAAADPKMPCAARVCADPTVALRLRNGLAHAHSHPDRAGSSPVILACVYGRAVEALQKADDKNPDRQKKIVDCRNKALADLRTSMKLGFQNTDWMKKDPDLNSLHDLPDFQKLVGSDTDAQKDKKKNSRGDDALDSNDNDNQGPEEQLDPDQIEADVNFLEATP